MVFFEYFNKKSLEKLLILWRNLLKKNGFITTRACASYGITGKIIDLLRVYTEKVWLGVKLYIHSRQELRNLIGKCGFKHVEGFTPIPTPKRYSLIKGSILPQLNCDKIILI